MKKVIDGKTYDTDTAILIGHVRQGKKRDPFYFEESLYLRPRAKDFFLVGEGGRETCWRVRGKNGTWRGGSGLYRLDLSDAREWVSIHYGQRAARAAIVLAIASRSHQRYQRALADIAALDK